jgi:RNA polymerase sigma-70 factor (ECF subfamily)
LAKRLRARTDPPILGAVIGEGFPAVLASAQAGSEAAFSRLWRDANPPLLRYLRVIAADAADDVAAETWVQVVRGLAGFRGDEAAWRAWLFTTARRRAIDAVRHSSRHRQAPLEDLPPSRHPVGPDPAEQVLERLDTQAAVALVSRLPRLQAEVIMLRVVAGLDTDSVARLVGKSPGAVRVAAHRGLRRLAGMLAEAGVTL